MPDDRKGGRPKEFDHPSITSIRLSADLHDKIIEAAKKGDENGSVSEFLRLAAERELARRK